MPGLRATLAVEVRFCRFLSHPGPRYVNLAGMRVSDRSAASQVSCDRGSRAGRIPMTQSRLMPSRRARRGLWPAAMIVTAGTLAGAALGAAPASAHTTAYRQINLVSDQPGKAPLTDPDLVNA